MKSIEHQLDGVLEQISLIQAETMQVQDAYTTLMAAIRLALLNIQENITTIEGDLPPGVAAIEIETVRNICKHTDSLIRFTQKAGVDEQSPTDLDT